MTTTTNIPFERVLFSNRILSNDNQFVTTTEILDSSSDKDDIITMNPEEKVITNPFENTSTYKPLKDSSELQIDDYKNQMKDTTSSLELMENKDKEDHAVFEWYIPLFSTIYMDSILSIDNSSKETRNSEMDEFVKEFFRNVEEQNELYSSSISDEITESSRMDVKSDYWNPQATWDILEDWKQDSTEASIFISEEISEEKSKSSFSHDSLIKKEEEEEEKEDMHKYFKRNHGQGDIDLIPSFAKDEDSEKSDTSKVEDDNMNEWKSGLFSTSDWRMPDSSIERSNTEEEEESTEKNISTEMSVTSDEQQIEKVVNILKLWGIIDRDDDVDSSVYSSTENVDSEKKIESEQRQEQNRCIKVIINGIEIMKCYFIPFQSTKEDLLGSLNYNSNEMKSPDEYVDNSYNIPYPDTIKESMDFPNFESKKQDYEMKSPDEYVDNSYNIPYPDTIKESMDFPNFESKKQDFSTEWEPKMDPITDVYPEENSYQDVEDPIRLWLDLSSILNRNFLRW
ncbi:PREDICTED: uncharacterized protein LOC107063725 [Polistes dominula]|uniref:Uncharacterized protein LOC107063725 n=1 Tax=Polistes dominula TaxID=743375 RepID=A0ABM1HTF4_POLDO|nr:PREDICTED: uncharacterized protein LOC107063725 [Polistes dominula]